MRKSFYLLLLLVAGCRPAEQTIDYTQFVDPLIGSADHGHVFVGANLPFGMVQLGPVNLSQGWDWCSGYHYSDSTIIGFSHTHLSGTGVGDLGDFLVMPMVGGALLVKGKIGALEQGYVSKFSHQNEKVEPGYYKVLLDKHGIEAELTATARAGYHRYRFPASEQAHILMDLKEGIGWDLPTESDVHQVDSCSFEGYRFSRGWAAKQKVYFYARFSKPMTGFTTAQRYWLYDGKGGDSVLVKQALCTFNTTEGEVIEMQLGISYVSTANARENLQKELPDWNFDKVRVDAKTSWNKELAKIRFESKDPKVVRTFYTAMYHLCFAPSLFQDVNGDYYGADGKIYNTGAFTPYTVFSLWDTYRAAHPLYTFTHPEKVNDFIQSFLSIYQQQGRLPVWHLVGNETDCMIGYHSVPVIVDAYFKGFKNYDVNLAYEAMKTTALRRVAGLDYVQDSGYIPADKELSSVAKGLEYAIDDWAIARMAGALGHVEDQKLFAQRAMSYKHYFDPETRFMRGKMSDGSWHTPFDPLHSLHLQDDYLEGNAWQYIWLVPHDVPGLIDLFGGAVPFTAKLDSLFLLPATKSEGASPDISGLLGQYAHGNEPGHATLYLYTLAGQPRKTAKKVRQVMSEFYFDAPSGLAGNEDCGQMSAWYIFSAMGFYPVNAAGGEYVFGSPVADKVVIPLPNGKTFTIIAENNSPENKYIQSISLNGQPYTAHSIKHEDIMKGGALRFVMGQ